MTLIEAPTAAAAAAQLISDSTDDKAFGEILLRRENDESDMRRRRQLRRRTTMQHVKIVVAMIMTAIMAMLAPMDEDDVAEGDTLGAEEHPIRTRGGGGERPVSISGEVKQLKISPNLPLIDYI